MNLFFEVRKFKIWPGTIYLGEFHQYSDNKKHVHFDHKLLRWVVKTTRSEKFYINGLGQNSAYVNENIVPKIVKSLLSVSHLTNIL